MNRTRVGVVILPEHPWSVAGPIWQRAEALGFAHAWTYDHLAWRSFRDEPWFAALPTLTAAALVTERIRLGTLVASPTFRHPVPFAKEIVALDDVARGRVTLGIGAGAAGGWDATMLGGPAWSLAERADRFAEFVELTDRLLREPVTSYTGRWYSADEARTYPGCVQQPRVPFTIAATGPRGMRLAAQHAATWVTTGGHTDEALGAEAGAGLVAQQLAHLDDACTAIGRDPASIDRLVLTGPALDPGLGSADEFAETSERYAAVGVTDLVVHWPRPTPPYSADPATFERIFSA